MAQYDPSAFGHFTVAEVLEKTKAWMISHGGTSDITDYYTVGYTGEYNGSDCYAVYFYRTNAVTMTGTEWSYDTYRPNTIKSSASIQNIAWGISIDISSGLIVTAGGDTNWVNRLVALYSMCNNTPGSLTPRTWANANLYSTINITNTDDPAYNYNSTAPAADFICTKDPNEYIIHLGVRATQQSDYVDYAYRTKAYTIHLKWTSPVTGNTFDITVPGLTENTAHYTTTTDELQIPHYNFSYTADTGIYARALRTPSGSYLIVPSEWEQLTDVPSLRDVALTELKTLASTQHGGLINDDLMTVITAEFYYNDTVAASKTVDFSSLFGEDIDIGAPTVTNPNGQPPITDDNVYTDHIDLTTPTLTATGVFNRCYVMDGNGVNDLCDYLYNASDSIFEEIIDGVLTRGSPIDSLIDLRLYPFDVRAFTGAGTSESIKFGRTDTGIIGIKLPHDSNAIIDLGHCVVPRYYHNFLDYQTTAELYIPFCGVIDLPIDRILNHKLSIKLIVDYVTGSGTAVVFVDNIPLTYQQGVIGVSIPMTATDSAALGQTIAGNLISGASAMLTQNPAAMAREAIDTAQNLWEGSRLMRIGASSPQTSLFQPLNAYLLLSIVSPAEGVYEDSYAQSVGYACFNAVPQLGYFTGSGLTCFDNVKLSISQATEQEKDEIIRLLKEGVYM